MTVTQLLRDYATALTLSNDNMHPGIIDQVHGNVAYLWYMANKARPGGGIVMENGGTRLKFPIIQQQNSTFKWVYGYDTVNPTPQDGITAGFERWYTATQVASVNLDEILENGGDEGVYDIANANMQIAAMSMYTGFHQGLVRGVVGTTGTDPTFRFQPATSKDILPLGFLFQKGFTNEVPIHSINQVTDTYWRNQVLVSTGTANFATFRRETRRAVHLATFGSTGDGPDLGLCNQGYFELVEAATDVNRRYTTQDADIKFEHVVVGGVTYIMDTVLPGFGSTATDTVTLTPVDTDVACLYLNTNWLQIVVHEMAYFQPLEWQKPIEQLAIFSTIVTKASHRVTQRRKHTLHLGVDGTQSA